MELNLGLDQINGAKDFDIPIVRANLLGWWRHNEGAGDKLANFLTGIQGDINDVGGNFWLWGSPDGSPAGAYDKSDWTNGFGTGFVCSSEVTLMAAYYSSDAAEGFQRQILGKYDGSNANYGLNKKNGEAKSDFYYHGPASGWHIWTATSAMFTTGEWLIVSVVFTFGSDGTISVRKNDVDVPGSWSTGNGEELPSATDQYLHIGNIDDVGDDSGNAGKYFGRMGDILVYNRALAATEITSNFNALRGRYNL